MADEARVRRVAENIRVTVTQALERRVKDPRLGFITITDVRVSGDLQHATVFYTVLGDQKAWDDTAKALKSAKGLVRSEVGKNLGLRLTPTIAFSPDNLPEQVASIEGALREARERDAKIAQEAQGKQFAGEADPYREPNERHAEDFEDDESADED